MEFTQIFTEMSWLTIMFLAIGVVFTFIEMFVPGFGFFGIGGILSLIAGVAIRIWQGLNLAQSLTLILIVIGFIVIAVIFMVYSAQYGILGKTGLFERRSTFDKDYGKTPRELKKLVGRNGKTISALNLGGQAKIRGKIYDVISISSYIEPNTNIKVVEIKDDCIMVRKWFE